MFHVKHFTITIQTNAATRALHTAHIYCQPVATDINGYHLNSLPKS